MSNRHTSLTADYAEFTVITCENCNIKPIPAGQGVIAHAAFQNVIAAMTVKRIITTKAFDSEVTSRIPRSFVQHVIAVVTLNTVTAVQATKKAFYR